MASRRLKCLLASAAAVGAMALLPAAASAHPEACADGAAWTQAGMTGVQFDSWLESVRGNWTSAAVARNYDDSGAKLAQAGQTGTWNLLHLTNIPKAPPFETEGDLNSDLAFED